MGIGWENLRIFWKFLDGVVLVLSGQLFLLLESWYFYVSHLVVSLVPTYFCILILHIHTIFLIVYICNFSCNIYARPSFPNQGKMINIWSQPTKKNVSISTILHHTKYRFYFTVSLKIFVLACLSVLWKNQERNHFLRLFLVRITNTGTNETGEGCHVFSQDYCISKFWE